MAESSRTPEEVPIHVPRAWRAHVTRTALSLCLAAAAGDAQNPPLAPTANTTIVVTGPLHYGSIQVPAGVKRFVAPGTSNLVSLPAVVLCDGDAIVQGTLSVAAIWTTSLALGDVDGDGDLDLVVGNHSQQNPLYTNLLRQLDAPQLLRAGHAYSLDVYARGGPTRASDTAFPYVATATASIPVSPFGTFGLDPRSTIEGRDAVTYRAARARAGPRARSGA